MPAETANRRILVADSDPIRRAELLKMLAATGSIAESCAEGTEALNRLLAPNPPFAAIIDLAMPGLDCLEICRQLSRKRPDFPTWILAVEDAPAGRHLPDAEGAGSLTEIHTEILELGLCDLLTRPLNALDLRLRLKTAERVHSMRKELECSMEATNFQASHDPLTGLWNREALLGLLAQETDRVRRTSAPMSLILMDLDRFAHRNLEFGYAACDVVLQQVAVRLRRDLRSYDLLGRSGEDEFLIALPGCELDDAITMAERFRSTMMDFPFHVRGASLHLTASFGVVQSAGRAPLIALREAELALAGAKDAGRDRIRFLLPSQPLGQLLPTTMQDFCPQLPQSSRAAASTLFPLSRKAHSR